MLSRFTYSLATGTMHTRRTFLGTMTAAGAATALHGLSVAAQVGAKPHRLDVHQHFVSPSYYQLLNKKNAAAPVPGLAAWKEFTPARALEGLDRIGAATGMVSVTAPG